MVKKPVEKAKKVKIDTVDNKKKIELLDLSLRGQDQANQ